MWIVNGDKLKMTEGDFGIQLPVTVSGTTLTAQDVLKFVFKKKDSTQVLLEKTYTPTNNTANLELTEEETTLFPVGWYVYSLDWFQAGAFMCNILPFSSLEVVDKA